VTANVQVSGKTPAGIIFVVGGNDVPEFLTNLAQVVTDPEEYDSVLAAARSAIVPLSAGAAELEHAAQLAQAALGGTIEPPRSFRTAPSPAMPQAPTMAPTPSLSGVLCKHGEPAKLLPAGMYKSGERAGQPRPPVWVCARPQAESCKLWMPA
jgi:hypothetical protein